MPEATPLTTPFWTGVVEGVLRIQRCEACGKMRFYPSESCPHCAATAARWEEISGRGTVYTWTVVHRSVDPQWHALAPYAVAIVEIEEQEGVFVPGLLRGVAPEEIRPGMRVAAIFAPAADGSAGFGWSFRG